MLVFKDYEIPETHRCPLCNNITKGDVVLAPIAGSQVGARSAATPVHLDCLLNNIVYYPMFGAIAAKTAPHDPISEFR